MLETIPHMSVLYPDLLVPIPKLPWADKSAIFTTSSAKHFLKIALEVEIARDVRKYEKDTPSSLMYLLTHKSPVNVIFLIAIIFVFSPKAWSSVLCLYCQAGANHSLMRKTEGRLKSPRISMITFVPTDLLAQALFIRQIYTFLATNTPISPFRKP